MSKQTQAASPSLLRFKLRTLLLFTIVVSLCVPLVVNFAQISIWMGVGTYCPVPDRVTIGTRTCTNCHSTVSSRVLITFPLPEDAANVRDTRYLKNAFPDLLDDPGGA